MGISMRLICPECAAQYEVDQSVIPEAGRDVQCSNCGHTWWQMRDGSTASDFAVEDPHEGHEDENFDAHAQDDAEEESNVAAAAMATVPNRSLDDAVLDVLREEAEHEAKARENESGSDDTAADQAATTEGTGQPADAVDADDTEHGGRPRSSRLPDIDEINSTLDGRDAPDEDEDVVHAVADGYRRRKGFRIGFLMMTAMAAGLALIYAYAGVISARIPSLAPTLTAYTENVDQGRVWLDNAAVKATQAIQGLTSGN